VKGQVAALMYQLVKLTNATLYVDSTGTDDDRIINGFTASGYSTTYIPNATSWTQQSGITYSVNAGSTFIKNTLNNNKPILVTGLMNATTGHAWVIDGWGTMTSYVEYYQKISNPSVTSDFTISLGSNVVMVHCNMGQDGRADGWYIYGIFDTKYRLSLPGASTANWAHDFSSSTSLIIPSR
jgi:hypothetical protein